MPWTAADARRHTSFANTRSRQKAWAKTANEVYATTGDDEQAIRVANHTVKEMVHKGIRRSAHKLQGPTQREFLFFAKPGRFI